MADYKFRCAVQGSIRRGSGTTMCDYSPVCDSDKCAAHGQLKCPNKIKVKEDDQRTES